jgi:hypothetical protein
MVRFSRFVAMAGVHAPWAGAGASTPGEDAAPVFRHGDAAHPSADVAGAADAERLSGSCWHVFGDVAREGRVLYVAG